MTKGSRIVVGGKIGRYVEILHSAWDGTSIVWTDSQGYLRKSRLQDVRVPRLRSIQSK